MNVSNETDDRRWCGAALRAVSRTFSQPIEALRPELSEAVCCAYLLCRVADTVEDHGELDASRRDALFGALLATLESDAPAEPFERAFAEVAEAGRPDHDLCLNLHRVLAVYRALPSALRDRCTPLVAEMVRGMSIYGHRPPGPDGLVAVRDLADLERYCYYVAGTVGHLLTELFAHALDLDAPAARALRRHAEEFGLGLQLVNVLKDVTDDRSRRVSYIPRALVEDAGIDLADMTDPDVRAAAHRAMAPIFERARRALAAAFDYTLAIPADATDVRTFCLLPLFMASATLDVARHNDAQLVAGAPVKISRERVFQIVDECTRISGDDAALQRAWNTQSSIHA